MNDQIINALASIGVPVSVQTYFGKATTYITFFTYLENVESYADNKETSISDYIQVDVWSKGDYTTLVNSVLNALKQAEFRRTYVTEMYENDTKMFHKIIRVNKNNII